MKTKLDRCVWSEQELSFRVGCLGALLGSLFLICQTPTFCQAQADQFSSASDIEESKYSKSAWAIMQENAERAAQEGFLGRAEYLFEQARVYALIDQQDHSCFARTLQAQAKFYRNLKKDDRVEQIYQRAYADLSKKPHRAELSVKAPLFRAYADFLYLKKKEALAAKVAARAFELEAELKKEESAELRKEAELKEAAEAEKKRFEAEQERSKTQSTTRSPHLAPQADVDFTPYMSALRRRISERWTPLRSDCNPQSIVCTFKIDRKGAVSKLHLDSPSQSETANQSALRAIEASSPFQSLPAGAPADVDVQFTFEVGPSAKRAYGINR